MGAYCHFILINESELLNTKLTALVRLSSKQETLQDAVVSLLEQSHIEKPVEDVTVGDFGQLKDFVPFFYYKIKETTKKLGISDQAFFFHKGSPEMSKNPAISDLIAERLNEGGGLPFMWVVDPGDIKVQGFERWLFNLFSMEQDNISFPLDNMPEFVEFAPEFIPSFIKGFKRILGDIKERKDPRGGASPRDNTLETLHRLLDDLEQAPESLAGNLTQVSAKIQQIVNTVALEDMSHNIYPEILEQIGYVLEELDIRAEIPEDPQECLEILRNNIADPRIIVWGMEQVKDFCQRVRQILKPYSSITTNKALLDSWNPVPKKSKKPVSQRESMAELRMFHLTKLQAHATADPGDLSGISVKLQSFVNMLVAHAFNGWIPKQVIDTLKSSLKTHEINAFVAEDWHGLTQFTKDHLFDTRPIVWDAEEVGAFCTEIEQVLQRNSPAPLNPPKSVEPGNSLDLGADQCVVTVLEDVLKKLEDGIKRGFKDYLCIISD